MVVSPSGLVTVTGGKWTTYRRMAADAVDRAAEVGGLPARPSDRRAEAPRLADPPRSDGPLTVYGSDAAAIRALAAENPGWDRPLHPALPYCAAEVVWAARHEAARSVEDVLARRTRALFLDARASIEAAPAVAALLAAALGRDPAWREDQVARFRALADGYLAPDGPIRRSAPDAPGTAGPPDRADESPPVGLASVLRSHLPHGPAHFPGQE